MDEPGTDGILKVIALKRTGSACPAQWEGKLEDGRSIYMRYRWGELSVGVGDDVTGAIENSMSSKALFDETAGDEMGGWMDFEDLKSSLRNLMEFSEGLEEPNGQVQPTAADRGGIGRR